MRSRVLSVQPQLVSAARSDPKPDVAVTLRPNPPRSLNHREEMTSEYKRVSPDDSLNLAL